MTIDRLGIFCFLWACQALVHQDFFQVWIRDGMVLGWLLTGLALAVLLRSRNLLLFAAMLATSVAYNVGRWPFVVNHILVETVLNTTMLLAIGWTAIETSRRTGASLLRADLGLASSEDREALFQRFAPVLMAMMVTMYYFAVLAKLNAGFFVSDTSCTTALYGDLLRRFPFAPTGEWIRPLAIWATVAVELAIPIGFTFRRTRPLAIALGFPFHLMLGLIGYRTFSSIVFVLYFLFVSNEFTLVVNRVRREIEQRWGGESLATRLRTAGYGFVAAVVAVFLASAAGLYESGFGPFEVLHLSWLTWIGWALVLAMLYAGSIGQVWFQAVGPSDPPRSRLASPGLLWLLVGLVVLNGSTQYLGLKTKTSFTMYSNLRTEGGSWNHLVVPSALRLASYQDDLVEIVETDHPKLQRYVDARRAAVFFEFQRITSRAKDDLSVTYRRDGELRHFDLRDGVASDPELRVRHPLLLEKLLYFRGVPDPSDNQCLH